MDVQTALRFVEGCIDRYAEQAWRTAYVMLSNAADADDLLQQAFLVAWRKAEFAPRDNTWPWLAAIIAHEARNFRRKRARRRGPSLDSISEPAMENDPNKNLERVELAALVHVSLAELDEDQRIAVVLTHLGGLSQTEAASALGVPVNTLKARVRRGLDNLRDALGRTAPNLENTLKTLPVAPPIGGLIAAKAAWTAGLSANVAVAGTATVGAASGFKTLFATAAAAVILTVGVVVAVTAPPDEPPKPYVAQDVGDEPTANKLEYNSKDRPEPSEAPPPKVAPQRTSESTPNSAPTAESLLPKSQPQPLTPGPDVSPARDDRVEDGGHDEKPRGAIFSLLAANEVEVAVDKGCDWLKQQQGIDLTDPKPVFGTIPVVGQGDAAHRYLIGRTAFPVQALCWAGCFVDDPAVTRAMDWLRENYTENGAIDGMAGFVASTTCEDAALLLAVEAYYISAWEAQAEGLAAPSKRFRTAEDDYGRKTRVPIKRWGTDEARSEKQGNGRNFKLEKKDQKMCEIAIKALEHRFHRAYGGGGWRDDNFGGGEDAPEIEVRSTYHAIQGLACAARLGIRYDKKMLIEAYRFLRGEQDKDGPLVRGKWSVSLVGGGKEEAAERTSNKLRARGWCYARKSANTEHDTITSGGMTVAAVNALILIRAELAEDPGEGRNWEKLERECNQMIGDGFGWLVENWANSAKMSANPNVGMIGLYHFIYSVQQLGRLGAIAEIGDSDWYVQGSGLLLEQQEDDGRWDVGIESNPSAVYCTGYALMFLKRVSPTAPRPVPTLVDK
jgi:RNA polymerase sigma-70 factor (ECF subfamily)